MAFLLSQVNKCSLSNKPLLGKHLFDILTSGMYNDPLMIYREYIQNAVDSIDLAATMGLFENQLPEIRVTVIPGTRTVSIYDNGTGIDNDSVQSLLSSIALSAKDPSIQRGFRGIGRLSGLAYSREVFFETRSSEDELVSVFKWDKTHLEDYLKGNGKFELEDLIRTCTEFSYREAVEDEGEHFFRVTLGQISQFYNDQLLSLSDIKNHIATTCPVPYKKSFEPFAKEIREYIGEFGGFKEYSIFVNGEKIYKPYDKEIPISQNVVLATDSIELFSIQGISGEPIAKGWVGISNFPGSLPKKIQVRGIRLRQGNLALGDEYCCSEFYSERRFTTWNIGEIHCNSSLIPNARRDGFEVTPDCEKLFEALIQLGKYLSQIIRNNSKSRSELKNFEKQILSLEEEYTLLPFLGEKVKSQFSHKLQLLIKRLIEVKKKYKGCNKLNNYSDKLKLLKTNFDKLNSDKLNSAQSNVFMDRLPKYSRGIIQEICEELHEKHGYEVLRSVITCLERRFEEQE